VTVAPSLLRDHARAVWQAAVDAARPEDLIRAAFADPTLGIREAVAGARRILVLGAGKAGAAMSAAVEKVLGDSLDRTEGWVNVPAPPDQAAAPECRRIHLHPARPAGSNQPTAAGVAGSRRILELARGAGPDDVALCLLSGGGSALLPAPVEGVSLEDKQRITGLLHACGATINEMNAVRKHLSDIKGGRLAQAFAGRALYSLNISDVIGDPLDVIASGPTAPDPTTFADALAVLERHHLIAQAPPAVLDHLRRGAAGRLPDTPKDLPPRVHNYVIGNNVKALAAAARHAEQLGYRVLSLGSYIEGETRPVGTALAGVVRSIRRDGLPLAPPVCLLSGGETTVTLTEGHGRGGRNQELVLAAAAKLGPDGLAGVVVLSGGTDGEDGPTDAAGALADAETLRRAAAQGLDPLAFLGRNDAYPFFEATGGLLKTGLTWTNVMDVRVILVE
jgi:hydroxypyruvate reductase/glycerate 2-kinase